MALAPLQPARYWVDDIEIHANRDDDPDEILLNLSGNVQSHPKMDAKIARKSRMWGFDVPARARAAAWQHARTQVANKKGV